MWLQIRTALRFRRNAWHSIVAAQRFHSQKVDTDAQPVVVEGNRDESNEKPKKKSNENPKSKYRGVYYHRQRHVWRAAARQKNKYLHLGCFESELEAAQAYDIGLIEYNINEYRMNFPKKKADYLALIEDRKKTPHYRGVFKHRNGFIAMYSKNGKNHYAGKFKTTFDAAVAYDKKLIEMNGDLTRSNFHAPPKPKQIVDRPVFSSKYRGVSYNKSSKVWTAAYKSKRDSKQKVIGNFQNELDAAMAYDKRLLELNENLYRLNFDFKTKFPPNYNKKPSDDEFDDSDDEHVDSDDE